MPVNKRLAPVRGLFIMEPLELNLPAKIIYLEAIKKERRNQMRKWRKMPSLTFMNEGDYQNWLTYTKWHKRPVAVSNQYGMCVVTFLDYKG
jgi:hypothetical protein